MRAAACLMLAPWLRPPLPAALLLALAGSWSQVLAAAKHPSSSSSRPAPPGAAVPEPVVPFVLQRQPNHFKLLPLHRVDNR